MKRKGHSDYRWQRQQEAKREYQKQKKIKEKWEKMPVDASNELDYIKKLLDGQDVGNFVGENDPPLITKQELEEAVRLVWSPTPSGRITGKQHILDMAQQSMMAAETMRQSSEMSFSDYLNQISGEGYYK